MGCTLVPSCLEDPGPCVHERTRRAAVVLQAIREQVPANALEVNPVDVEVPGETRGASLTPGWFGSENSVTSTRRPSERVTTSVFMISRIARSWREERP